MCLVKQELGMLRFMLICSCSAFGNISEQSWAGQGRAGQGRSTNVVKLTTAWLIFKHSRTELHEHQHLCSVHLALGSHPTRWTLWDTVAAH